MILVWILLQSGDQIIHQLFGRNFHPPPGSVTSRETIPPLIISFLGDLAPSQRADIHLAVGLPLTWVSEQKDRFRKYLIQRKDVKFSFDGTAYSMIQLFPHDDSITHQLVEKSESPMVVMDRHFDDVPTLSVCIAV